MNLSFRKNKSLPNRTYIHWIVCVSMCDGDRCKSTCTLYRQRGREREREEKEKEKEKRESVCATEIDVKYMYIVQGEREREREREKERERNVLRHCTLTFTHAGTCVHERRL